MERLHFVKAVLEQAPVAMALYRCPDYVLEFGNPQLVKVLGRPLDELIGKSIFDFAPEGAEQGFRAVFDRVADTGEAYVGSQTPVQLDHDGKLVTHYFDFILERIELPGSALCLMSVATDVTDVVRGRLASQRSSARLQALASAALDISREPTLEAALSVTTDRARAIVGAHLAATSMRLGGDGNPGHAINAVSASSKLSKLEDYDPTLDPFGLIARTCDENRPTLLREAELAELASAQPTDAPGFDVPLRGWLAAPLIDGEGRNLGVIQLSDKLEGDFDDDDLAALVQVAQFASAAIDKARLLEQSSDARDRAEEANRLKDEFLAAVSHELRTPLNAISGWSQLLTAEELAPPERHRAHQVILRNATALGELVDDLIDVSRIVSGKLRLRVSKVDFADVVGSVVASLEPAAEAKRIHVDTAIDASTPMVSGDEHRLRQVVNNLVTNAIKFTPRDGAIEIALASRGSAVELRVSDTGEGIDVTLLESVFERFRQAEGGTTRRYGGLGLGLSIARDLVELHGGRIAAASEGVGLGTTITVTLPSSEDAKQGPDAPVGERGPIDERALGGIRALVVEDEDDARSLLDTMLTGHGAQVIAVASVSEALARLDAGDYDVLISDLGLPGLDGYDLIRRVRAGSGMELPAIALGERTRVEERSRALLEGYDLHLTRPIEVHELIATVVAVVARYRRLRTPAPPD